MNKEELLKIQRSWELRQAERDSIRNLNINPAPVDTSGLEISDSDTGLPAFSELPKIPGIGEGSLIDLFGKGIM